MVSFPPPDGGVGSLQLGQNLNIQYGGGGGIPARTKTDSNSVELEVG